MTHPQDDEINEPDKAEAAQPCDCDEGGAGCVAIVAIVAAVVCFLYALEVASNIWGH